MVASKSSFQILGFEELVGKFRKLRGPPMRKIYRQAMREAARPILSLAKSIVPIGETGNLQRSLKIKAIRRTRKLSGVKIEPGTRSELGIPTDAKGFYPSHIALGFKRGAITKFPGNRFLRDSLELGKADAIRTITNRIVENFTKIIGK